MGDQVGCFPFYIVVMSPIPNFRSWCGQGDDRCTVPGIPAVTLTPPPGVAVEGPYNQRLTEADFPATFKTGEIRWKLTRFDETGVWFATISPIFPPITLVGTVCAVVD